MNTKSEKKPKREECLSSRDILVGWYREAKKTGQFKSWRQLARKAKVNPAILSMWKTEGRLPGDETIYALADALGKDATPLLQAVIRERSERSEQQLLNKYGDIAAAALQNHNSSEWEMLMALLDSLPVGFFVLDLEEMAIIRVNQYFCEVLHTSKSHLEGHPLADVFGVENEVFPRRDSDDEPLTGVFQIALSTGDSVKVVTTSVAYLRDGKHMSVGLLKDVKDFGHALSKKVIILTLKDM